MVHKKDYTKEFVQVVNAIYKYTGSIRKTAKITTLGRKLVSSCVLNKIGVHSGRKRKYSAVHLQYLEDIVKTENDLYVEEIRDLLFHSTGYWGSRATVHRMLGVLKLSKQRLQENASERYSEEALEKRAHYLASLYDTKVDQLFFMDETGLTYKVTQQEVIHSQCLGDAT
jgi:hypothetical protein